MLRDALRAILQSDPERQLRPDLVVEASYAGKIGIKLEGHRHWNPAIYINPPR